MRKLHGLKWGDLTESEKEKIYFVAFVDKDNVDECGNCIIDIDDDLAIRGRVIYGEEQEIIIEDNAIFYNPLA